MVRNSLAFRNWDFRCGYLDLLIDLDGVAVNNLAAHLERYSNSQFGLSRSGRPDDGDNLFSKLAHAFAMIMRMTITSQMTASISNAPIIWFREKRISG